MDLSHKVAIVTGAGSGIGRAVALQLAASGARVVVNDIDDAGATETVDRIRDARGEALAAVSDIATWQGAKALADAAGDAFDAIDILVNNAGITADRLLKDMDEGDWDRVLNINLKGAFNCCKFATPRMIAQQYGKIVNLSSRAHLGNPGQANYSASKAGLIGLTRSLALELGRYNINVNAVAPGMVDTEGVRNHPRYDMIVERALKITPLKRIGTPADIAYLINFLVSDMAGYITGEIVHITGGRY